ncbi:MAG: hypothetical protein QOH77_912, partial [Actinomycetota bacterium]|nr:hypothetical protein [Actinomycetota bacterium]
MGDTTTTSATTKLAELGERYFTTEHTYDPYNATLLGLSEFDHLPGDPSLEASEKASADFLEIAKDVAAIDVTTLDEKDQIDHGVLTSLVRGAQQDAEHSLWAGNGSAKSYISRQALIFQTVPAMTVSDSDSAERYLERLSGIAGVLTAVGDRYAVEAGRGRVPTELGVTHSIAQLDGYLALGLEGDVLLKVARDGADAATIDRATAIVEREIRPAMSALADRLRTEFLPIGRPNDKVGIKFNAGGEEGYLASVARHTTTS